MATKKYIVLVLAVALVLSAFLDPAFARKGRSGGGRGRGGRSAAGRSRGRPAAGRGHRTPAAGRRSQKVAPSRGFRRNVTGGATRNFAPDAFTRGATARTARTRPSHLRPSSRTEFRRNRNFSTRANIGSSKGSSLRSPFARRRDFKRSSRVRHNRPSHRRSRSTSGRHDRHGSRHHGTRRHGSRHHGSHHDGHHRYRYFAYFTFPYYWHYYPYYDYYYYPYYRHRYPSYYYSDDRTYPTEPDADSPVDEYEPYSDRFRDVRERMDEEEAQADAQQTGIDRHLDNIAEVFAAGDFDKALLLAKEAVDEEPDSAALRLLYSQTLFATEKHAYAAVVLRYALAQIQRQQQDLSYPIGFYPDESALNAQIDNLARKAKDNPDRADLQLLLGYQLLGVHKFDQAELPLQKARDDVINADAARMLIDVLQNASQTKETQPPTEKEYQSAL
ncbi:MAG: tetratricopeptide repeat protein [Planctomycetota bacterium]